MTIKNKFTNRSFLQNLVAIFTASLLIFGAYSAHFSNQAYSSACSDFNSNKSGCQAESPQCTWDVLSCSAFNSNMGACTAHAGDGCAYPGNTGVCSTFNNDISSCTSAGCTYHGADSCGAFADATSCASAPGGTCVSNTSDCSSLSDGSSCSAAGCTITYSNCGAYNDEGNNGSSCNAFAGQCSYDSGSGVCSGDYFSSCSGGSYFTSCTGTYDSGQCTGSYDTGECTGNYEPGTCSGSYDNTPPSLGSTEINGNTVTLTFDEDVTINSTGSVEVRKNGSTFTTIASSGASGPVVTITLNDAVISSDSVVIYYDGTSFVHDAIGNYAEAVGPYGVNNTTPAAGDTTAPVFQEAHVDGTALSIAYDETLDAGSVSANSDFTVTVDSVPDDVTNVDISANAAILTLTTDVRGGTVHLIYTPGGSPIQDTSGNDAVDINSGVINDTDTSTPTLSSFTSSTSNNTYTVGQTINVTANFNKSIQSGSTMHVVMDTGAPVTLDQVSGTTVYGTYTVRSGDSSGDLTVASITDSSVNDLHMDTFTGTTLPGSNIANTKSIVVDGVPPSLQSARVNGTALTLTYNESLDTGSVPATTDYVVTVNGSARSVTNVSVPGGTTVVLTLASAVVEGSTVALSYTKDALPIQDTLGNDANDLTGQSVTVADTTPPSLTSFTSSTGNSTYGIGQTINVTANFNEAIGGGSMVVVMNTGASVTLDQISGTTLYGSYVVNGADSSISDLTVSSVTSASVSDASSNTYTSHTVPGSPNNIGDSKNITIDTTVPTLSTSVVDGTTLTLTYDQSLDTGSVPDTTDFSIIAGATPDTVSFVNVTGSTVVLTLDTNVAASVVSLTYTPGSNPVQNSHGNNAVSLSVPSVTNTTDVIAPTLSSFTSSTSNGTYGPGQTINITAHFNEALAGDSTMTVMMSTGSSVVLDQVSGNTLSGNYVVNSDYSSSSDLTILSISSASVTDTHTNEGTSYSVPSSPNNIADTKAIVVDTTAPVISTLDINNRTLTLTYGEALDTSSVPATTDYVVNVNSTPVTISSVQVSGTTVTLTLASVTNGNDAVTVSYIPGLSPIGDLYGNDSVLLSGRSVTNTGDAVAPLFSSATVNYKTLTLTYGEALDTGSVPATTDFTVYVDSTPVSISSVHISGSTVVLTLSANVGSGVVTFDYNPGGSPIQDAVRNHSLSLSGRSVTNATDIAPPTLSTATVSGSALVLTYNETLSGSSSISGSDFEIIAAGLSATISDVSVSGSTVNITLSTAVRSGQVVTLSYTSGAGKLQDESENLAGSLVSQTVTNATSSSGSSIISGSRSSGGSGPVIIPIAPIINNSLNNFPTPCTAGALFSSLTGLPCGGVNIINTTPAPSPTPNPIPNAPSPTTTGLTYTFTKNLYIGARDIDIYVLQKFLNKSGFTIAKTGPGSVGSETIRFGDATFAALVRFQKSVGILPATGAFGPKTRAYLNNVLHP